MAQNRTEFEEFYEAETGLSAKRGSSRVNELMKFVENDDLENYEIILKTGKWYALKEKYSNQDDCMILGSTTKQASKNISEYCIVIRKDDFEDFDDREIE